MIALVVLPHLVLCPFGLVADWKALESICDCLLVSGVKIPNQCGKMCACLTCVVVIISGKENVSSIGTVELTLLGENRGQRRLSCQSFAECSLLVKNVTVAIEVSG